MLQKGALAPRSWRRKNIPSAGILAAAGGLWPHFKWCPQASKGTVVTTWLGWGRGLSEGQGSSFSPISNPCQHQGDAERLKGTDPR